MQEMILSSGLFNGEAVERFVSFNDAEVDLRSRLIAASEKHNAEHDDENQIPVPEPIEPMGAYFELKPITGSLDADYTKRRGQDRHEIKIRPKNPGESGPAMKFDEMNVAISNEQEIAAMSWLAEKVVCGWRGIKLDTGDELEFNKHNLKKLATIPSVIKPVIAEAYALGAIQREVSEGN